MNPLHSLQLAIEQAERSRDERAKVVARMVGHLEGLHGQLSQLQSYAQDTDKRWITSSLQQISGEMVRHHYQFMGRLQHAMDLQTNVIASAMRELEAARKAVMDMEIRLSGLRNVLKSRQAQLQRDAARHEQHRTDEFAALAFARNAAHAAVGEQHDY